MDSIFVVTLRGKGVWHDCQVQFAIKDTTDETLEIVRQKLAKSNSIEVYEFFRSSRFGTIEAGTSRNDVTVYVEEVAVL